MLRIERIQQLNRWIWWNDRDLAFLGTFGLENDMPQGKRAEWEEERDELVAQECADSQG